MARAARRASDGDRVATNRVSVPGDGTETVPLEHTFETTGEHPIAVVGQRIGTVTVEEPDDGDGDDGSPGFGVVLAIVGLLGGLAARRLGWR